MSKTKLLMFNQKDVNALNTSLLRMEGALTIKAYEPGNTEVRRDGCLEEAAQMKALRIRINTEWIG
jgi:hypothetical protein